MFKLERSVGPEDRAGFDEVASLARDFVNQKRELVDLYEQRRVALTEQSVEERRDEPRDPANDEWDAAVAKKHGEAVVEAGNEAPIEIEHNREGLDHVDAGELPSESKGAFQAGLNQGMERAAQLGVEGNSYIREVAKQDPDLQRAIEQAEIQPDPPDEAKGKAPSSVDSIDEQQHNLRVEEEDRDLVDNDAREAHELASTVPGGETTGTDPAKQHIPRLEELEREQMEQRERDQDDRDR